MKKNRWRTLFSKRKRQSESLRGYNIHDIAHDMSGDSTNEVAHVNHGLLTQKVKGPNKRESLLARRNRISPFAFGLLGNVIPKIPQYRDTYERACMPVIFEAYMSTGFLIGLIAIIPTFLLSFILEIRYLPPTGMLQAIVGSLVLGSVSFATILLLWMLYPIFRSRNLKTDLESRLAYSFGILGVLSTAGISLDRLFERIAVSESNPVLADLAKRFLRNVRLFGMDSEAALKEVAAHSSSHLFASMLDSIAVSYKTTGTIRDLVLFESARLLQDKTDGLKRAISGLSIMAELYITLVVVGPIIFIVMLSIFGILPNGGLPNPILLINVIVFLGIPVLSIAFILLLDSTVGKT